MTAAGPKVHITVLPEFPVPGDNPVRLVSGDGPVVLRYAVAPVSGGGSACVTFDRARMIYLGHPNDEALGGHRLAPYGLTAFACILAIPIHCSMDFVTSSQPSKKRPSSAFAAASRCLMIKR
jgi:hypothetical protein